MEPSSLYENRRMSEEGVWEVFHRASILYWSLLEFLQYINLAQNYFVCIESETQSPWTFVVECTQCRWKWHKQAWFEDCVGFSSDASSDSSSYYAPNDPEISSDENPENGIVQFLLQPVYTELDASSPYHVH